MSRVSPDLKEKVEEFDYADDGCPPGEEHREYLVARHGTSNLDPIPYMDDADPLNWGQKKKILNLSLVAFHAMMFSFTAAAIQCAFVDIAADLKVSVHETTYLVALFIAVTGSAPLFWGPMSNTFGRRPVFLISLACTLAGNVACALSPSYAAMAACRAITAFFISPAASLGGAVVSEIFFKKQRGRYMGVWTVMISLGIPTAPLVFGFVAFRVGYRWIYWILAITNSVQVLLHFFLGSETRYDPKTARTSPPTLVQRYFGFQRINPKPIRPFDFVRPLTFVTRKCVIIAASSHAMVFLWATIMTTLEIPQIFPKKFGLNTQQVGLQNIGIIIGTLLGEQVGGFSSDKWMTLPERRGKAAKPEFRLWLSYIGYILAIGGVVIFLVQIDQATKQWNVTPLVGAGIAAAGNQIVTTVLVTYAVDCYPKDAAAIGGLVNFVRQTWGFIGPFWFPLMIEHLGLTRSTAVPIAMIVGVSVIPTMLLQWKGRSWNEGHKRLEDSE